MIDDVRGEIIGQVSNRYSVMLQTVEVWAKHGRRYEYPARLHSFNSELGQSEAIAEYLKNNSYESKLGDGTACFVSLETVKNFADLGN